MSQLEAYVPSCWAFHFTRRWRGGWGEGVKRRKKKKHSRHRKINQTQTGPDWACRSLTHRGRGVPCSEESPLWLRGHVPQHQLMSSTVCVRDSLHSCFHMRVREWYLPRHTKGTAVLHLRNLNILSRTGGEKNIRARIIFQKAGNPPPPASTPLFACREATTLFMSKYCGCSERTASKSDYYLPNLNKPLLSSNRARIL